MTDKERIEMIMKDLSTVFDKLDHLEQLIINLNYRIRKLEKKS